MKTLKEKLFALGYMPHRLWGNIFYAQILDKDPGEEFFRPKEIVLKNEGSVSYQRLTPMQREVVHIIDEYNERKLHQLFSKKGTVKEFQDHVDQQTIRDHIRPYIEKQLFRILEIARENRIKIFLKEKSNRNVFPEDFLVVEKFNADPVFTFRYNGTDLIYALSIIHGESRLVFSDNHPEVISHFPAALILGNRLFFISNIDAKKLKPFFLKDEVIIAERHVKKYFSSFVRNTLRDHNSINEGFEVREIIPDKYAEIILAEGLEGQPVFELKFHYYDHTIEPESNLHRFVDYYDEKETICFKRYSRDFEWEENIESSLGEIGLRSRGKNYFYLKEKSKKDSLTSLYRAINFVNENKNYFDDNEIRICHKSPRDFFLGPLGLEIKSNETGDWFDLQASVTFGEFTLPFLKLRKHILQGEREYILPDGTVAILPEEWFSTYQSIFQFGKIEAGLLKIHKQHFSMVDESIRNVHAKTIRQLEKLNELDQLPVIPSPVGLKAEMRKYQSDGFSWLYYLQVNGFGGCLADDMGLGKTLQAIAIILKNKEAYAAVSHSDNTTVGQLTLFKEEKIRPTSLIVVPASLIHNWINECSKFAPSLKVYAHVGIQRDRELVNLKYYDVVVSSYHTVRQDIEKLSEFPFHYVILDESQMIKNPGSKLYRAMNDLVSEHRLVLTGTPIENSLTDLWSQINYVNEGLLGSLNFFKKQFVQPIEKKKNKEQEKKLKEIINPFILRRTKEEVARELPPIFEQVKYCNMTDEQRRMYEEEKSLARNSILENLEEIGLEKSTFMVLQALTRLRQISNHPVIAEEDYTYESGKFNEVIRDVESLVEEKHKVLIFSSFVKHLDIYRDKFNGSSIHFAYLTGSLGQKERNDAINKFQKDSSCSVFLISLKAGGIGLNLTAADYVFILDPWWNPAAELQALNRAHRIGQDKNVFVYRFISIDSIEEKIQRLQEKKSELAKTFVTSNNPLKYMSKKDVLELFA